MDKNSEIAKLERALRIPVTDILFNSAEVEVVSGTKNIGSIEYHTVSAGIIYDIPKQELIHLNWDAVYEQNIQPINIKIIQLVGTDEIEVVCGTFRSLYINDENGQTLQTLVCEYENGNWIVS